MRKRGLSRRELIKTSGAIAAAATTGLAIEPRAAEAAALEAGGLKLRASGYPFARLAALFDGRVRIEGCDTEWAPGKIGDMNTNVFSGPQTLDVTEIGLHPFMIAYANDGFRDYTLLPIFPLRLFRHKSIFVRTDRGIRKPEDLRGKSVATPGYSTTSLTWIRGILQDEYGVSPTDVEWVTTAADSSAAVAGKASAQEQALPDGLSVRSGPPGKDESDLLESGEVDALLHAAEPRAYVQGHPDVARLFPDYRSVERAYYSRTGIFPIMHAVAVRLSTLQENPWLAEAVFAAYSEAKQMAYDFMTTQGWVADALPWYGQELEETKELMGANFYSYGIPPNKKSLEALFRYSQEQGLSKRRLAIEELFHPSTLEFVEANS